MSIPGIETIRRMMPGATAKKPASVRTTFDGRTEVDTKQLVRKPDVQKFVKTFYQRKKAKQEPKESH